LSDDLDSLLSCYFLTKYRDWNVKYFYDFSNIYKEINVINEKNCIGIDMDILKGKCFSNHVVDNENENCINLNRYFNIHRWNYTKKYGGSTLLMVLSILDIDINTFTEEQQEILLCVDSTFLHYNFDNELAEKYIGDILQYPELIKILKKHDVDYFKNIQGKYNLKSKIYMDDWNLISTDIKLTELSEIFNINLELPNVNFEKIGSFNIGKGVPQQDSNIFSLAWTYRNSAIYSYY
jgi:hypothetical protein